MYHVSNIINHFKNLKLRQIETDLNQLEPNKLDFEEEIKSKNIAKDEIVEDKVIVNNNYEVEVIINHQLCKKRCII
jgi:hypothetical protein